MTRLSEGTVPDLKNKHFNLTAEVDLPSDNASGMIVTQGGRFAGWALYLLNGTLVYYYNWAGMRARLLYAAPSHLGVHH
jgi:hypothetical protein